MTNYLVDLIKPAIVAGMFTLAIYSPRVNSGLSAKIDLPYKHSSIETKIERAIKPEDVYEVFNKINYY